MNDELTQMAKKKNFTTLWNCTCVFEKISCLKFVDSIGLELINGCETVVVWNIHRRRQSRGQTLKSKKEVKKLRNTLSNDVKQKESVKKSPNFKIGIYIYFNL